MLWKDIDLKIEKIYNNYKKLIFSIAYSKVKNYHLAEDIVQETVKKIIKYPDKVNELEGEQLRNYVSRIAYNTACNYVKKLKEQSEKVVFIDDLIIGENSIRDDIDIEDFVINKDNIERMKGEIRKLDAKYRDPLTLHNLNRYTIAEVSELLGVPERTVKYRINKAIQILRDVLSERD